MDSDLGSTLPPAYEDLPSRRQIHVPVREYVRCVEIYPFSVKLVNSPSPSIFSDMRPTIEQQSMNSVGSRDKAV